MSAYRLAELKEVITDRQLAHDLAKQRVEATEAALQRAKDDYITEVLNEPTTPTPTGFATTREETPSNAP